MADVEAQRRKTICEIAGVDDIGDLSDGFHTFNSLYEQRMILFAALLKVYKDKAWKSYRHEDGEYCFGGGWFIVGIDTPEGSYTYHYENKYFDLFDCEELACGKHWDGHTEKDVTRLLTLPSAQPEPCKNAVHAAYKHGKSKGIKKGLRMLKDAQPETCEGCKHLGKWENEVEYGYPSPCTCCKRRAEDRYESRKSPKNEVFIVDDAYKENVENLPYRSVQPEQRWIPVTERLPDDETDILVTYIDGEETRIVPVNYDRGTWFDCIFDRELKPHMVTAWMLRPESYKGDEK